MDDSDDYGFNDLVFDEQTLAALDKAEQNYYQKSPSKPLNNPVPVNKRHKTVSGWSPGLGAAHDDFDDLPEISVRGDGSYSIRSDVATKQNQVIASKGYTTTVTPSKPSSNRQRLQQDPKVSYPQSHLNTRPKNVSYPPSRSIVDGGSHFGHANQLEMKVQQLQEKFEELQREHNKTQSALKEAADARLVKEGEVSILRKNIEKNSQKHAAQIAQLQAEKEIADAKQLQLQKELKDEMERLRSQLTFKQLELEASTRRPPLSTRAKKGTRDIPATPLPHPGRNWATQASTSQKFLDETPLRPVRPHPPILKTSPTKNIRKSPEKKRAFLPGFQNAFISSTPLRSPSKRHKEKVKAECLPDTDLTGNPFVCSPLPAGPSQFVQISQKVEHPATSNAMMVSNSPVMADEEMDIVTQESDEGLVSEEQRVDWINWKVELCRIVLTRPHPSTNEVTFQHLLGSVNSVQDGKAYSLACAKILGVLAASSNSYNHEESLRIVCASFLSFLAALCQSDQLGPMLALIDLLTTLVLCVPGFQGMLLSSSLPAKEGNESSVISVIQTVILQQLVPDKIPSHDNGLAGTVLTFLESICFQPSPESIEQLQEFARNRDVVVTLIQSSHPAWFLDRSYRLLALLSTHHSICGALLGPSTDSGLKNVLIDILCGHLIDTNRPATQMYKSYILVFFAQMSIADPSTHTALVDSYAPIPSLISFTSHLTAPLWEDDDQLISSKEAVTLLIQIINQTLFLLYRLVFATDPCVNLRSKIQQAPLRPFSTLLHIFTVAFGRLSYCDPPSWVDEENRQELESIAEIGRDILELVIDGPEGDSVWAAFQSKQDEDDTVDAEELEAQLIGDDV